MATLKPGTPVTLIEAYRPRLIFPPPRDCDLYVAVHPGAMKAGERSPLTQAVGVVGDRVVWVGAIDERMVEEAEALDAPLARDALARCLLRGESLWLLVWPGGIVLGHEPLFTVYSGARPWAILGELEGGSLIAAPMNDATNPKWFTPVVEANEAIIEGSKRGQVELAHLWSFPASVERTGRLAAPAQERLARGIREYFNLPAA